MNDSIQKYTMESELTLVEPAHSFSPLRREASVRGKTAGSLQRFERAALSLSGGVSSGLRRSARPYPLYFSHGQGARLHDVDGNSYLDYTLGWGPNILGNAPAEVIESIQSEMGKGLTFGAQHDLEYEVAEMLTHVIPCADRVCFANSGTEIVQVALRLARAITGRRKFLKFEGHYHGWDDSVLLSYHPSRAAIAAADGKPIHEGLGQLPADSTLIAQWNDVESVRSCFEANPGEIAAVICEPMMCNSGCIEPAPGFLEFLRQISSSEGALLIFDEVITGFRLGVSGAQGYYGVLPDLATYAKAVGAGMPLSVLAGPRKYMDYIERGEVVHAGTLNGNPIALASARAALRMLTGTKDIYVDLFRRGEALRTGIAQILEKHGHKVCTAGAGPVFHVCFIDRKPQNYRELLDADREKYSDFLLALLDEGVLPLPDGRWYVSTVHSDTDIQATLDAVERSACTS